MGPRVQIRLPPSRESDELQYLGCLILAIRRAFVDPHVISALKAKRAELSGELIAAENASCNSAEDISI